MAKLWEGRTSGETADLADRLNASISFDNRMAKQDITGSIAHAAMLKKQGIISEKEAESLKEGLVSILEDLEYGSLEIDMTCEDIHTFVEQELTKRIGEPGKKLHTARSRNDQVALDLRLYLRDRIDTLTGLLKVLIETVNEKAEQSKNMLAPGYTHLQRAQPIMFGHQLLAYAMMLLRDIDRLKDCRKRLNISPIGSCAFAGTTYPTDRFYEAELMGFDGVCLNSVDGVSDRDFCLELLADLSVIMMHLSRFSEEIVLWTSWEFRFVSLSDAFTTGSSIMPQKKNSDMAELVRGKTGRVYGDLMGLLTVLKGLPLAYNKDMQEDKESVFDACDTAELCIRVFDGMVKGMTFHPENMKKAAQEGFINATDLADYLTKKGLPFRSAYQLSGEIVAWCMEHHRVLETMTLEEYRQFGSLFDEDVFAAVDLWACANSRISYGGAGQDSVEVQLEEIRERLKHV